MLKHSNKKSFFITCKESRMETPTSFYSSFYIGPFDAAQSLTVANALRRTLLSEIRGIAITSVHIEGAAHEYATLKGVHDSVLDILMNLKEVVLKTTISLANVQYGYLKVKGPGIVKAKDLKLPAAIQCVDPEQYIATLGEEGLLNMKFKIHQGHNYIITNTSEEFEQSVNVRFKKAMQKFQRNQSTNFLEIDAIFMPVNKVNYIIEKYDWIKHQIILEIWTNGSLQPRQAIFTALKKLYILFSQLDQMRLLNTNLFNQLIESNKNYEKSLMKLSKNSISLESKNVNDETTHLLGLDQKQNSHKKEAIFYQPNLIDLIKIESIQDIKNLDIGQLNISLRAYTSLKNHQINTIADLINYSPSQLLKIKNFGNKSLEEIQTSLKNLNLNLTK